MPPRLPFGGDRRRRLLINRVQATYVVAQLGWTAAILTGFACLVFGPTAYTLFAGTAHEQQGAAGLFLELHARFWPSLIALAASLAGLIVVQSHRVIGPLVRFKAVFDAVARGELCVPTKIRRSDYPQDESRALEAMLLTLRERIGEAKGAARSLDVALQGVAPDRRAEARAALARLDHALGVYGTDGGSIVRDAGSATDVPHDTRLPAAGFSLVEVLLVSSVIGLLAAIAVPGYEAALEKARVTRAIGDIRALQSELQTHGITNGCYPDTLAQIGYGSLRDPWGSPYVYGVLAGAPGGGKGGKGGAPCAACGGVCLGRGQARKDRNLVPINSDFDFYSMGRDHQSVGPLTAKASQDDVVRASDGGFIGLGRDY